MPGHASSDTPPDPMPVRGHDGPSLYDLLESLAREMRSSFKEMRQENANANRDTQARLGGIESRLSEGASTISKHAMQLAAVIEECAEHHRRIETLERDGGSALLARVVALESKDTQRAKDEGAAKAVADAAAQSPLKKILGDLVAGAARSLGPVIIAFLSWVFYSYMHAQQTPAPAPTQAGAHP